MLKIVLKSQVELPDPIFLVLGSFKITHPQAAACSDNLILQHYSHCSQINEIYMIPTQLSHEFYSIIPECLWWDCLDGIDGYINITFSCFICRVVRAIHINNIRLRDEASHRFANLLIFIGIDDIVGYHTSIKILNCLLNR